MREEAQLQLLCALGRFYGEVPFSEHKSNQLRYFFDNGLYTYSDAILLQCMMRQFQPNVVIEIGSGFSSAVMLDTDELFLSSRTRFCFVEPYPDRLLSLVKKEDLRKHQLVASLVQDVPTEFFQQLKRDDMLFIDSSHVSKCGSDVNRILFDIMPILESGVLVHFHDVFFPFEYPREWILGGKAWNEDYILRAFLQYNTAFEIVLFNTYLEHFHEDWFARNMPMCLRNRCGSIWLRKLSAFSSK